MTAEQRTRWLIERAHSLGFELAGVCTAEAYAAAAARLPEWVARGYAGEMRYLHDPRRLDVRRTLPGAQSIVVCAMNYQTAQPLSTETPSISPGDEAPRGWVARYAWGDDYHTVLGVRLKRLVAAMRAEFGAGHQALWYVDTGPVVERLAARAAGLGWLGKNTSLINEALGSWLFLGVVVTTLELAPTAPADGPPPDLCGQCRLCIEACPTEAIVAPYLLDPRRCISYLTIELRGEIPEPLREGVGRMVFGCDICQDVCPWNRRAPSSPLAEFEPRALPPVAGGSGPPDERRNETRNLKLDNRGAPSGGNAASASAGNSHSSPTARHTLFAPELDWLLSLTEEEFREIFRGSAMRRTKWRGLVRNACIAAGNLAGTRAHRERQRSGGRGGAPAPSTQSVAEAPSPPPAEPGRDAYARLRARLELLAASADPVIASAARWGLANLK
jgi:epoxyqueuosine reductase